MDLQLETTGHESLK